MYNFRRFVHSMMSHLELQDHEAYEVKTEATEVLDFKITFVRVHIVNILV